MSDRIRQHHLDRSAIVYVRQSTQYQLLRHHESRRLQYAMKDHVRALGWPADRIEIIDDDLGVSAAVAEQREGFDKLISRVCKGGVGAVAAREVSRFARNSREWQHLVEVCRVVDTILLDHETIYDPRNGSDRLLLGVKGSLNEYELDVMRARSLEARNQKAARGELILKPVPGYVKTRDNRLEMDPDRRVQDAVRLVFSKFFELGTARQTLYWFLDNDLMIPAIQFGDKEWTVRWRRPSYDSISGFLNNPVYAGVYAHGKSQTEQVVTDGLVMRKRRKQLPEDEWKVRIENHHDGYISLDEYDRIRGMLKENRQPRLRRNQTGGPPKTGHALLSGLLRCARCGRKLRVNYSGPRNASRYICPRGQVDNTEPKCIHFGGKGVDESIGEITLRVVQPMALEAAAAAYDEYRDKGNEILSVFHRELEEARYEANRARKQYDATDPENRLVASELERRWNAALERIASIERKREEQEAKLKKRRTLSVEDFTSLSRALPEIWESEDCDVRLKKRILRTLINEIVVDDNPKTREIEMMVHWKGGAHTKHDVHRYRMGEHNATDANVVEAIKQISLICADKHTAVFLSRCGLTTKKGHRWTRQKVSSVRNKRGIPPFSQERKDREGWMNLSDSADLLGVTRLTLRLAAERGEIPVLHPLPNGPWIFNRDDLLGEAGQKVGNRARQRCSGGRLPGANQASLF